MSGIDKLNLKEGILNNLNLDFEVTLVDSGRKFKLEDRDLLNLLQRKLGVSPVQSEETFTGEFDLSKVHDKIYPDYDTGSAVNLTTNSIPVSGSAATVRIQGDKTGTIPASWNQSGDTISTLAGEWNEITIMYISSDDIRFVNRVFTK